VCRLALDEPGSGRAGLHCIRVRGLRRMTDRGAGMHHRRPICRPADGIRVSNRPSGAGRVGSGRVGSGRVGSGRAEPRPSAGGSVMRRGLRTGRPWYTGVRPGPPDLVVRTGIARCGDGRVRGPPRDLRVRRTSVRHGRRIGDWSRAAREHRDGHSGAERGDQGGR
jgi:hypothetical protein